MLVRISTTGVSRDRLVALIDSIRRGRRRASSLRCSVKAKRMGAGWATAYLLKVAASIQKRLT